EQTQYLISAALITSGITSIIQVMQIKIPKTNIVIGTGLVSVMGTSFTFLPTCSEQTPTLTISDSDKKCSRAHTTSATGGVSLMPVVPHQTKTTKSDFLDDAGEFDGVKAYGAILGTFLICSWVEIILAFIKPQVRRSL
ncbi:unnamed protein product, partial [Hapterophycus canaliculatus]